MSIFKDLIILLFLLLIYLLLHSREFQYIYLHFTNFNWMSFLFIIIPFSVILDLFIFDAYYLFVIVFNIIQQFFRMYQYILETAFIKDLVDFFDVFMLLFIISFENAFSLQEFQIILFVDEVYFCKAFIDFMCFLNKDQFV
ncbi:hypothetical protein IMG5_167600 [Ichthyophthirius multifiliis]|uniref:Uncharacterized protein n=1 Tax=Ichthyophthirius multifiliis TaxID=5932 RepID=G0R0Y6_ICHMU|nr:hypothetical protein IMG5_167600 [Ichthyophthirius multifiliis]EGR28851.1 hypothetical protein IMG5_167600 [Ichthyophthirius multifiliis]|eukprot:XP_004030087.1 hypothetical protein IMG5_167600 [Ichthyophthirius multifiliis]